MSQAKGLSTWFIFSKNQLLVSLTLVFCLYFTFPALSFFPSFNYKLTLAKIIAFAICLYRDWTPASLLAQIVKSPPAMQETWVWSLSWEDPLEEEMASHSSNLDRRIPKDRGDWWVAIHGAAKKQTQLSNQACKHAAVAVDLQHPLREFNVEWGALL